MGLTLDVAKNGLVGDHLAPFLRRHKIWVPHPLGKGGKNDLPDSVPTSESRYSLIVIKNPQRRFAFGNNSLYGSNNYSREWLAVQRGP